MRNARRKGKTTIIILITILVLAAFCIAAFYNGLVVKKYVVGTDKFGAGASVRVVLLADLHSHIYGGDQAPLISKIIDQHPDLILLAGDIADDQVPIDGALLLLEGIGGAAPVFFVSGNHEYWSGDIRGIKAAFRGYGVTVLEDECREIAINGVPLVIAGMDDPEWTRYEIKVSENPMDAVFKGLSSNNNYKILVAHRPELIESYKKYTFDLVVSGHAHGGQVRIPFFLNGLIAPNQGVFPKYAGGLYRHDGAGGLGDDSLEDDSLGVGGPGDGGRGGPGVSDGGLGGQGDGGSGDGGLIHVVSRGLSFNPRLPRVFNPPEIVVIDIEGEAS